MKTTLLFALSFVLGLSSISFAETTAPETSLQAQKKDIKKETLTGIFTEEENGKVFLTTLEGKRYIVVPAKIDQIGENYDKEVTAVCKTKFAKNGKTRLIVQINKVNAAG